MAAFFLCKTGRFLSIFILTVTTQKANFEELKKTINEAIASIRYSEIG